MIENNKFDENKINNQNAISSYQETSSDQQDYLKSSSLKETPKIENNKSLRKKIKLVLLIYLIPVIIIGGLFLIFYTIIPWYKVQQASKSDEAQTLFKIERDLQPPNTKNRYVSYFESGGLDSLFAPPSVKNPDSISYTYKGNQAINEFRQKMDQKDEWKPIEDRLSDSLFGTKWVFINTKDYGRPVCIEGSFGQSILNQPNISIYFNSLCVDKGFVVGSYDNSLTLFNFLQLPLNVKAQEYNVYDPINKEDSTVYSTNYGKNTDQIVLMVDQYRHTASEGVPNECERRSKSAEQTKLCSPIGKIGTGEIAYYLKPEGAFTLPEIHVVINGTNVVFIDRSSSPENRTNSSNEVEVDLISQVIDKRTTITPKEFRELIK